MKLARALKLSKQRAQVTYLNLFKVYKFGPMIAVVQRKRKHA